MQQSPPGGASLSAAAGGLRHFLHHREFSVVSGGPSKLWLLNRKHSASFQLGAPPGPVCVCEPERIPEYVCMCVRERERESLNVCVCVTLTAQNSLINDAVPSHLFFSYSGLTYRQRSLCSVDAHAIAGLDLLHQSGDAPYFHTLN